MNRIAKTITALMCVAVFSAPAFAEEKAPPPPPPAPGHEGMPMHQGMPGMGGMGQGGGMGMGMMGGMSDEQMDVHLRMMQEKMLRDYDFMRQIHDAKDEKEQARLKDEWLKAMKQHMKAHQQMPPQLKMHGMPEHGMPEKAPGK